MGPLTIRRHVRRLRGSLAAVACVLALGGVVAAHHTEMPSGGGMDMGGAMTAIMCLGVLGLAAVALARLPRPGRLLPGLPRPLHARPVRRVAVSARAHPARAGPPTFLVLSVLRR